MMTSRDPEMRRCVRRPYRLVVCKGATTIQPKKLFGDTGLDGIWQFGAGGRVWRAFHHEQEGNQDK